MIKDIKKKNDSINVANEKIDKLREIFPDCFNSNGDFDIINFQNNISKNINITKEGYGLNFLGKNYAKVIASYDSETILVPDEKNNNEQMNKNSKNIYITGDNIDALKHLEKSYSNKIKCIYIDPPYNTGTDGFGYNDKFNFSIERLMDILDVSEDEAKRVFDMTNSKSNSHSAWLTFMYPRIRIAKSLLSDLGVLFISIDEHELSNCLKLTETLFGDENIDVLIWRKNGKQGNTKQINRFKNSHEYVIVAYKNKNATTLGKTKLKPKWNGMANPDKDPRGNWMSGNISNDEEKSREDSPNYYSVTTPSGKVYTREWYIPKEEFEALANDYMINEDGEKVSRIHYPSDGAGVPRIKRFENELQEFYFDSIIDEMGTFTETKDDLKDLFDGVDIFSTPKPVKMIMELIRVSTDENDIILDFFSGSSATAHAVMNLNAETNSNRKFIMVQWDEKFNQEDEAYKIGYRTIDEVGRERIRRAGKKIKEETNADIDYGFKNYYIKDLNKNTLDKLEKFEPNWIDQDKSIIDEFGVNSVLTTWMNIDGYGLSDFYDRLQLDNYEAYKCDNTIYLINPNLSDKSIKCLIEKYENDESFDCNRIVLFGYSFDLNEIQTLKDNLKQVKNIKNINVDLITRY